MSGVITVTEQEITAELARRNVIDFCIAAKHDYIPAWFHRTIGDYLGAVVAGEIKRLMIMMPPRHGKSEVCSRTFPAWFLGYRNCEQRSIIAASYNQKLARTFGRAARNKVASPLFSEVFGETLDRTEGSAAADWTLTNGNAYSAAGVNGGITGLGASVFLIDDPIKDRKQADSATYRENLKDWYKEVALTRLTPDGAMIIIMTRWHYDDLVGWLLNEPEWQDEEFEILRFPAIQTEQDSNDPRPYDRREPGQALWPERYSLERLEKIEEGLGPLSFNCLYQQTPNVEGGKVLDINDFVQDYELGDINIPTFDDDCSVRGIPFQRVVSSWDTAFESKKTADYSVGTIWGDTGREYYLLDIVRGRWRFPQLKKKMIETHKKWKEDAILIESKASGKDLLYALQDESNLPVQPVNPVVDKVARAAAVSGRFEAGRVHAPRRAPWLRVYLTELEHFPEVAHDDQVDSTTQAIRWMSRYSGSAAS